MRADDHGGAPPSVPIIGGTRGEPDHGETAKSLFELGFLLYGGPTHPATSRLSAAFEEAPPLEVGDRSLTRLELEPDPENDTTWIHVLESVYSFNPDLFIKLFVQSNSALPAIAVATTGSSTTTTS